MQNECKRIMAVDGMTVLRAQRIHRHRRVRMHAVGQLRARPVRCARLAAVVRGNHADLTQQMTNSTRQIGSNRRRWYRERGMSACVIASHAQMLEASLS